jgi:hypothetical protein
MRCLTRLSRSSVGRGQRARRRVVPAIVRALRRRAAGEDEVRDRAPVADHVDLVERDPGGARELLRLDLADVRTVEAEILGVVIDSHADRPVRAPPPGRAGRPGGGARGQ